MSKRKVIITCAVTGSIHTPSMSPHLPVTAGEIAEATNNGLGLTGLAYGAKIIRGGGFRVRARLPRALPEPPTPTPPAPQEAQTA